MIDCISVETMRLSDEYTIRNLVPSLDLMYRAAYGVYMAGVWDAPVAIVAGSGNNGGDGFALACILKERNIACTVFTMSHKLSEDSAYYAQKAVAAGVAVEPFVSGCLKGYAVIVDCLLGTGFSGVVRASYHAAIQEINDSSAYVLSVDINSGLNGDDGTAEIAVRSDMTVTIGYVKNGLVAANAGRYIRRLVCADIGIILIRSDNRICSAEEWKTYMGQPGYIRCPEWLNMDVLSVIL